MVQNNKAFVMFVTFLLFLINVCVVLAHGKCPNKAFIEIFLRQKTLNKSADHHLCFTHFAVGR